MEQWIIHSSSIIGEAIIGKRLAVRELFLPVAAVHVHVTKCRLSFSVRGTTKIAVRTHNNN
jgi:hypothetical protein